MTITRRSLTDAEEAIILAGLDAHSIEKDGVPLSEQPFGLIKHDDQGRMIGGMVGRVFWDWLYIDLFWVDKNHRGEDIGTALFQNTEAYARELNLVGYYLTTQSWEALDFYLKMGMECYAEFNNLPRGHKRYCLRKYL